MAEQAEANKADLEQLKLRQEALLNKIGSLQSRLNNIQRSQNVPYDISRVTPSQFKQLQCKQSSLFERLLDIAGKIENIAQKQSIPLPAENEIASIIQSMAQNLEQRQKRSLAQLRLLSGFANSIQSMGITPEIKKLIIDEKEEKKKKEEKKEEKEEEKEEQKEEEEQKMDDYKSRKYDLELVSECLRAECMKMDNEETGKITNENLTILLEKVSLIDVDGSINNEKHIELIINELTNDSIIDYNKFFDLICDCSATDKLSNSAQWNLFRYNLIGKGRVDGSLRILYRYDGWPEPQLFVIKDINTINKNKLSLKNVLDYIQNNTKNVVEYKELRYALNPTFVPGKRGWQSLKTEDIENETVPFLVNNDGTLEIDIWLRTKDFIENKKGRPQPEGNDDDLVDID